MSNKMCFPEVQTFWETSEDGHRIEKCTSRSSWGAESHPLALVGIFEQRNRPVFPREVGKQNCWSSPQWQGQKTARKGRPLLFLNLVVGGGGFLIIQLDTRAGHRAGARLKDISQEAAGKRTCQETLFSRGWGP